MSYEITITKQRAEAVAKAAKELFEALPKSKRMNYIGHLNYIYLFIDDAKRAAPGEAELEEG